ncbi:hypothetical protein HFN_1593 [Helicobacter fennelliae MRY12-0050]|uniref:Uncharacterized protein n=1 Tax=Helicobacter fennelliae MRY12-0050 TaxID=1325130 RepID=T1D1W4_9HELI|nr:hypothetical protein HFN_1593 [Helicobacter fennelliae MRY12-0050]
MLPKNTWRVLRELLDSVLIESLLLLVDSMELESTSPIK